MLGYKNGLDPLIDKFCRSIHFHLVYMLESLLSCAWETRHLVGVGPAVLEWTSCRGCAAASSHRAVKGNAGWGGVLCRVGKQVVRCGV